MRRVSTTIGVDASAQRVWDLYADVAGSVEWVPFTEEILCISGPAGLGQVYVERTRLGGVRDVAEWEVIEWDPPRRQAQRSTSKKMDSRLIIQVEPHRGGALLTQEAILESRLPPPVGRLHELLFAAVAKRGIERAAAAAKRRLEEG